MLSFQFSMGQQTGFFEQDSLSVIIGNQENLQLSVTTPTPRLQMSFLMQGLSICMSDMSGDSVLLIKIPGASDVKDKLRHHPNEVKAMHGSSGEEIRPDLTPLLSVLNEIVSVASDKYGNQTECRHHISIEKKEGLMTFEINLPKLECFHPNDTVIIDITSKPIELQREFAGRQLSRENRRPPGGLGQAPDMLNDINRNIHFQKRIMIGDK